MASRVHMRGLLAGLGLLVAIGAGFAAWEAFVARAASPPIAGLVHVTEIKIAPEISGRFKRFRVAAGAMVRRGDILAELDNPELAAAVVEATAALDLARATRDRVYAGLRQEEVDILARDVEKTTADLTYAQQQLERISALSSRSNASLQDLDRAIAAAAQDRAELAAAQARLAAGRAGPTREERLLADAKVAQAEAALAALERRLDKTQLAAPADGMVRVLVSEPGEAVVPGQPIMTLDAAQERWISFNIREDGLKGIDIGTQVDLTDAAGKTTAARVTEIRGLGEFATWRAARAAGDHDLNTFLVRMDPLGQGVLEPGMTLWLPR